MNKDQKIELVENLTTKFKKSTALYFTKYTGMNVEQATMLRQDFPDNSVEFLVSKDFYNKSNMNKINFVEGTTQPITKEKSFVYSFLSSVRQKINNPNKKKHRNQKDPKRKVPRQILTAEERPK